MKTRIGLFLIVSMLAVLLSFGAAAEIPEIYADETTGQYEITYSGAEPYSNYTVIAVEGVFEEDYVLDLSDMSSVNVMYYNAFTADVNGDVVMSLVPMEYVDSTLFIGGAGLEAPAAVCRLMKGEAVTVADFEIELDKNEYYVGGLGMSAEYVSYRVKAKDSFGFESAFPYDEAERAILDYDGELMSFVSDANALQLENSLPEGTYSFSITYGGITKTASFDVKHNPSVPKFMTVTLNGTKINKINVSCMNTTEGSSFNPEKVIVAAEIVDQYLNPMQIEYTFEIKKPDGSKEKVKRNDGIYEFVPVNVMGVDDSETYTITVYPDDMDDFESELRITVTGVTNYTGDALRLFKKISEAKEYEAKLDGGEILISEINGNDIHYTKLWTTTEQAEALRAAIADGEAMLVLIDEGTATSGNISKALTAMTNALNTFVSKTKEGNYSPIESLSFVKENGKVYDPQKDEPYRLAKGQNGKYSDADGNSFVVKSSPSRPSEKPVYYSENPEIASVNENSGAVSAKSVGTTKIYAKNTDGSISAYYNVTVYVPITSVKYAKSTISLIAGQTVTPELVVLPEDHSDVIKYTTNAKSVATIDEKGKIKAVGGGTATITATSGSGKSTTVSIAVTEPKFSVTSSCIATNGTKLSLPVEIESAEGIDKLTVTARFDAKAIKFESATDAGLAGGYVETSDNGAGVVTSSWENISFGKEDRGKLVMYNIEVLPEASKRDYDIKFNIEGYTKDGDKIVWEKNSGTTTVKVGDKDTYTVKVDYGTGGTASVVGGNENNEYKFGEELTVRARPSSSYNFLGWYSGAEKLSTEEEYTFTVTKEMTIQARFVKRTTPDNPVRPDRPITPSTPQITVKQVSPITSNVASGVVAYGTEVTLSTTTVGATIYYTLDGTTPTVKDTPFTAPIVLKNESTTISAVAVKSGMSSSNIARFTYRIEEFPTATPVVKKLSEYAAHIKFAPVSGPYFRPNDAATRYEVMEMLSFLFEVSGGEPEIEPFSDVSDTYKGLVETYAKAGVINGYPDGSFGGFRNITRAEFVKILSVLLNMDVTGKVQYDVTLSDISGHWAENNIKAFVDAGYILGYPEGDFRPDRAITRAEVVTVLNRITGVVKLDAPNQYFVDVKPEEWFYSDIMNSANIPQENNAESTENAANQQ